MSPEAPRLREALVRLEVSKDEIFDRARQDKYNGVISFHFREGKPVKWEAGRPLQGTVATEEEGFRTG